MTHSAKSLLWVIVGGAFGAAARYLIGNFLQRRFGATFPWNTLLINLSGCFVLGIFIGLRERYSIPAFTTPGLAIGFLGAYTTFSTFAVETVALIQQGSLLLALLYCGGSVSIGLLAALGGLSLGRVL